MNRMSLKEHKAGFGTTQFWYGHTEESFAALEAAVCEYGITMIDTAEMYGEGRCEETVGKLIRRTGRDRLYIVDKILPDNADSARFFQSLDGSLQRLGTDCIDLYLLHWRENADLSEVSRLMEEAKKAGKIRSWGVSNFDVSDMEDLMACPEGKYCEADQICYNLLQRGCEYDLLPWLKERGIAPMAYNSLDVRAVRNKLAADPRIRAVIEKENISIEALMLWFVMKHDVIALFQTSSADHLRSDAAGLRICLDAYAALIDTVSAPPMNKVPLVKR